MMMAFHTFRLQKKISMHAVSITSGSAVCVQATVFCLTEIQVSFIISLCNDNPRGNLHRGMTSLNLVPLVRVECTH